MNLGYYIGFGVVFYLISAVALLQLVSIVMDFKGVGGNGFSSKSAGHLGGSRLSIQPWRILKIRTSEM